MNKSLALSVALGATFALQSIAAAADLFDTTDPGYIRQLVPYPNPVVVGTGTIRVQLPSDAVRGMRSSRADRFRIQESTGIVRSLSDESLLSQPIRLTLGGPVPVVTK